MSLMYVVNPGWLTRNPFVPKRENLTLLIPWEVAQALNQEYQKLL